MSLDRDTATKYLHDLLRMLRDKRGSDLLITAGTPPCLKVDGQIHRMGRTPLTAADAHMLVYVVMNDRQVAEFESRHEVNFALNIPDMARFRISAFVQRGTPGMVLRLIRSDIATIPELNLPTVLERLSMEQRGMVIMVGGTGCGKSTSLAAMVDYRNENATDHIITIEDPIEFLHAHKKCVINQREVGIDTESYGVALRNTLRQAPNVILIGEIRDRETMDYAVAFAETGHLVLATLHATNANQAFDRIINFFPEERRAQLLMDLSFNLKALVSQRLVPRADGAGLIPAVEVLINTPLIAQSIFQGRIDQIKEYMRRSTDVGMQTFDQALFELYESGFIEFRDAMRFADSINDLRLRIKLHSKRELPAELSELSDIEVEPQRAPVVRG